MYMGRGQKTMEKFRLLDGFLVVAHVETDEQSRTFAMLCTPTLSRTAIFMLTLVSQKQIERCHVRSSKLLVLWAAFEDVDYSIATAHRLVKMHFGTCNTV